MQIFSFARYGYAGEIVKVEADLRRGIPAVDLVGLPDGAVKEARERMRAAIRNQGLTYPKERILINLSPADLKKEGSAFDLPIALAVLTAKEKEYENIESLGNEHQDTIMALGELELSGIVRPVKGVLAAVSKGFEHGITRFIIPQQNEAEAKNCKGAIIYGITNLSEALHAVSQCLVHTENNVQKEPLAKNYQARWTTAENSIYLEHGDIADIKGQEVLVRSLEIAAAGGHNLIAYGPPGCGKTLALSRFSLLLPDLDERTSFAATRIHSIAGLLDINTTTQIVRPPFRQPHTSASLEGMVGGGRLGNPGEISLAHGGVLFLDEAAQFKTSVLQALRTPLETGKVTVTRAGKTSEYPSRFQLLLAINPCPCGNFSNPGHVCTCTPENIASYWRRIAFPLLDRIDLRVEVRPENTSALIKPSHTNTQTLRTTIQRARNAQWARKASNTEEWLNAFIPGSKLEQVCAMDFKTRNLFASTMEKVHFSARGAHSILRVARSIADLAGSAQVSEEHFLEAAFFRSWGDFVPDFLL